MNWRIFGAIMALTVAIRLVVPSLGMWPRIGAVLLLMYAIHTIAKEAQR